MEYTTWPEMLQNPNPNPNPNPDPTYSSSQCSYYPSLPQNPDASQFYAYTDPTVTATATSTNTPYQFAHGYYLDPNSLNRASQEASWQYGSDPAGYTAAGTVTAALPSNGSEQLAISHMGSSTWTSFATHQAPINGAWKKLQKKTKVVQSAYCEVCKVDCNSKEVFDQHKLGKKHKKNLEKLKVAAAGSTTSVGPNIRVIQELKTAAAGNSIPIIGPQENPQHVTTGNGKKGKKKASAPAADLETKRRKVVEGGAAVEAVRTCSICNVVCNSETVFRLHINGQKHAAMLRKQAAAALVGAAISTRIL
ncbi:hypothetical protein Tsubulata_016910 [Turnera subulata]|uniref:U1-type domain-containing protein n=1 Tax=Turnera subulata TaxID=218843 RepID=A0A9Q0G0L6_9ROSI|nr:hypothetical protein Tsubulata_016910 [Turnera subulata]